MDPIDLDDLGREDELRRQGRGRGPWFCPKCLRARVHDDALCTSCGERLLRQGYCGICESHKLLEVGAICPKHDCELTETPPTLEERLGVSRLADIEWKTVRAFAAPRDAEGPRIRLEAEGIPTFLEGERAASNVVGHAIHSGLKLMVPESMVAEARVILDQSWRADTDDEDELETAWDDLAPEPGGLRRDIMKFAIGVILIAPLVYFVLMRLGF